MAPRPLARSDLRCQRIPTQFVAAAVFGAASLGAEQEAAEQFRQARAAYDAERFEAARDGFTRAAQTDPRNPEVFLWLGRAQYALAELDQALAAFRRALELAPGEPFATRMVAALSGVSRDATPRPGRGPAATAPLRRRAGRVCGDPQGAGPRSGAEDEAAPPVGERRARAGSGDERAARAPRAA
ncbi:MAG: tetratricopeptide repeat protein [Planctomycetes bacterium]|nr:tetratricopeptide repeat protein [Planctomycetota bacterium]